MGWSDISIGLSGPVVNSLVQHFVERWNYILNAKYRAWEGHKYAPLELPPGHEQQRGRLFHDVHQRLHHGLHHAIGRDEDAEQQESQQHSDGQANIQLTRRYGR